MNKIKVIACENVERREKQMSKKKTTEISKNKTFAVSFECYTICRMTLRMINLLGKPILFSIRMMRDRVGYTLVKSSSFKVFCCELTD